ncbi:right-handed parallel beta-helix repeat-containing protein [Marinilabilia sp.]|uniref:right-handed parallel beta-helix repeat-containing protein n=1 Tax=Marinilabilia sp. TaxID=2021252 RepID=UPI0025C2D917|nr:right-handed parallel beta-helix repeat-containing protein [Marinilabilia sp.]
MKTQLSFRLMTLFIAGLFLFTACEDDETTEEVDVTFTAEAVADATVNVNEEVFLDGSNSTINSGSLEYSWTFSSKPGASNVQIDDAFSQMASFIPDIAGEYVVVLEVSDGNGETDQDDVTIEVISDVVEISEDITTDETWTAGTLYRVMNSVSVENGARLTIEPGVTVEFVQDAGLSISSDNSVLVAAGTEEEQITFTGEQEITGYWRGLSIFSNSVENEISHAEIRYAGSTSAGTYFDAAALTIDQAKIQLSDVTITNSGQYGIQTRRDESEFPMHNMTFKENEGDHAFVHISQLGYFDEASIFDGVGYVTAYGGGTTHDMTISALNDAKYQIVNFVDFEHEIVINDGAIFEFGPDAGIIVRDGSVIKANGTESNKIVFTGTSKTPGAWRGIFIGSSSVDNIIEHAEISYGGSSDMATYFDKTNMVIDQANITLRNISFTGSAGYGIQTRRIGSDFLVENCEFDNNADSHMLIHPEQIDFVDNQTNFNGGDVEVYYGDTEESGSETWSNLNNGVYYFSGSVRIDNSVTIEPGAFFEMGTDVRLQVSNEIKAEGTSAKWIVFSGRSKAKGAWDGILVTSSSVENVLDYVKIEYGGGGDLATYMNAGNLGVYGDAYLSAPNLEIENSAGYGVIVRATRDAIFNGGNIAYTGNDLDDFYTY